MSTAATETKKSLADVARISELTGIGWSVKEEDDGTFTAHEKDGDLRSVGPASSIKALHTQVMLAAGSPNGTDQPAASEQRLPTMEEPGIDELNSLADDCIDAKEKRDKAKTSFEDRCDAMRESMREHGRKRYNRRGFSIVIEDTEKLVIKKAENSKPPKNPKTPKVVKGQTAEAVV